MPPRKRTIVVAGFDGMQLINIVGPTEIFDAATQVMGDGRGYEVIVATADGRPVHAASGLSVEAHASLSRLRTGSVDTLLVGGGMNITEAATDERLVREVKRIAARARRTCSTCTGAFILAEAGLLAGREATTHWAFARQLQHRHPEVGVHPDRIFVRSEHIATSAGATAGIDLALALVQEDFGPVVAREVAKWTVVFMRRPGDQSQFSVSSELPVEVSETVRAAVEAMVADPAADHSPKALAKVMAVSERHLRRMFVAQVGCTPVKLLERIRVERACAELVATEAHIQTIAQVSGFGSCQQLQRAFVRVLGVTASQYRHRFSTALDQNESSIGSSPI